jgi:hypothetical protein
MTMSGGEVDTIFGFEEADAPEWIKAQGWSAENR